jgi:hypothetical protein
VRAVSAGKLACGFTSRSLSQEEANDTNSAAAAKRVKKIFFMSCKEG